MGIFKNWIFWVVVVIVAAVIYYYLDKKKKDNQTGKDASEGTPHNTGIIPDFIQGDLNMDGFVNTADQ